MNLGFSDKCVLVFSVYMPTNIEDNLNEFMKCLAQVSAIIESNHVECAIVLGDFNAHPGTLFGKELLDYCREQSLQCLDLDKLESNTYTFVSDAHETCRWLDHCIVTAAAAALVTDMLNMIHICRIIYLYSLNVMSMVKEMHRKLICIVDYVRRAYVIYYIIVIFRMVIQNVLML